MNDHKISLKKYLLPSILFIQFIFISGCSENKDLEKDTSQIADAMCRSIEIMNNLKAVNPEDTARTRDLQIKYQDLQNEMGTLYTDFRKKYANRMKELQFNKDFSKELRKAILNCRHLSKEDREKYEKEVE